MWQKSRTASKETLSSNFALAIRFRAKISPDQGIIPSIFPSRNPPRGDQKKVPAALLHWGRSMKFLAAAIAATVALTAGAAEAATLKASYLFNNNLTSSVGGAPDLVLTDPTGTSAFQTDTVFGNSRTVLFIGGDSSNANQGGFTFNSTGLLTSDSYSIALTFEFLERTNGWRRIVDVEERNSDNGFYVDPVNNLN
eukprot:gene30482-52619_t